MQSLYNVIKKDYVNANSIYTIKAPVVPAKVECTNEDEITEIDTSLRSAKILEDAKILADSIVNDASKKSRQIINSAKQESEKIKKDAYDAAFNKGYSEGLKKGTQDGFKSTEDTRKSAEDVLKEAHRVSREYIDAKRDEIVGLALHIAEKIIGYQVDVNESIVFKMVSDSINAAVVKEQVIVRVNPMDYALVDCRLEELSKAAGSNVIVSLIRDGDIKRGGCRIDTGSSSVDATIDCQFEKVKEALMG